jgi:hypothetical protein
MIASVKLENDVEKLTFLQEYIMEAKTKYSGDELYLLNRLEYHVSEMANRYEQDIQAQKVSFELPVKKSQNPLLR